MVDFRTEILAALRAQDRTQEAILKKAGIGWNKTCLTRKLTGAQPLTADEAVALADVLGVKATAVTKLVDAAAAIGAQVHWPVVRASLSGRRRAA